MEVFIRLAEMRDGEAIHRLNRDGLGYDYPLAETLAVYARVLQKPNARIWIATVDSEPVGYLHAADYDCVYGPSMKNILALAVAPSHQGRGLGRRLLAAVEAWAREEGASGIRLISGFDRKGAHAFYLACGYALRKEHKNFVKQWDGGHP